MKPLFRRLLPALVALGVFAAYTPSLGGGFVYDDHYLVEKNRAVQALSSPLRFFTDPGTRSTEISGLNTDAWRPLTALSYALDYAAAGPRPWFFRLVNLLLHCLSCLLLFRLAVLLGLEPPFAAAAAAFFGLFPPNVEAVAWISSRSGALSLPLTLLALIWYLEADGAPRKLWLAGAAAAAALLAKEAAVVLPLLAAAWLLLSGEKRRERLTGAALALALPALMFAAARFAALGRVQQVRPPSAPAAELVSVPFLLFEKYLEVLLWPFNLLITYTDAVQARLAALPLYLPLALAALALYLLLVRALARSGERTAAFGLAWFGLALLPVLNIVQMTFYMAERLLYLPSAGAALALAAAAQALHGRGRAARALRAAGLALALLFAWEVQGRLAVWRTDVNIWKWDTASNPGNRLTRLRYAAALREAGDGDAAAVQLLEALRLSATPRQRSVALNELGTLAASAGRLPEAERLFSEASRLDDKGYLQRYNLGRALALRGALPGAQAALNDCLRLKPDYAPAADLLMNLGAGKAGRLTKGAGNVVR